MRFEIKNSKNEVIAAGPLPAAWRPAPDIITVEVSPGLIEFFTRRGICDGIIHYHHATVAGLPTGTEVKGLIG